MPSNAAMATASAKLSALTTDQAIAVLQNHIVPSVLYSNSLNNGNVKNVLDADLTIAITQVNGEYTTSVSGAKVLIPADNLNSAGNIHFIDTVLIPTTIPASVSFGGFSKPTTTTSGSNSSQSTSSQSTTSTTNPASGNSASQTKAFGSYFMSVSAVLAAFFV